MQISEMKVNAFRFLYEKKRQGENLPVKIIYYSPNCC